MNNSWRINLNKICIYASKTYFPYNMPIKSIVR